MWRKARALALLVATLSAHSMRAQHVGHDTTGIGAQRPRSFGLMATGLVSHVPHAALGARVTEAYLTQPTLMARLGRPNSPFQATASLNLEGLTLARGEINPGGYGEGYEDRRHPHTYVHEALVGVEVHRRGMRGSLFMGKGFVPFGTDDPMGRPFAKYPVNHHLAQLLERAMVVGAARIGPLSIEAASFNGDEPERPADWPNGDRHFDSWSTRVTGAMHPSLEVQASVAHVVSPEDPRGFGLDQRKASAAIRVSRPRGRWRYGLLEWARTGEYRDARRVWTFASLLAEGEWRVGAGAAAIRLEHTLRPEEDRTQDVYRSVRPLLDFGILGRSRWTSVSLALSAPPRRLGYLVLEPFLEGSWLRPRATSRPTALDPVELFRASSVRMLSGGVRLRVGSPHSRIGRYGAAAAS